MRIAARIVWWFTKHTSLFLFWLMKKPYGIMCIGLLGLVACSSDSVNNTIDTITFDNGSPYGGTQHPTRVKIGKPYTIKGRTYRPRHNPRYSERGEASWYGPGFHGRQTANGERYDQHEMTAAHRTLPMPSLVRVTRLDTGKSIMVRVNDRGPFADDRIIDLSKAAAKKLNMINDGVASVKVEYLEDSTKRYIAGLGITAPDEMGIKALKPRPVLVSDEREADYQQAAYTPPSQPVVPLPKLVYAEPVSKTKGVESFQPQRVNTIPSAVPLPVDVSVSYQQSNHSYSDLGTDDSDAFREVLASTSRTRTPNVAASNSYQRFRVHTASFNNPDNARRHADALRSIANPMVTPVVVRDETFYRVSFNAGDTYQQATNLLNKTHHMGYTNARILVE